MDSCGARVVAKSSGWPAEGDNLLGTQVESPLGDPGVGASPVVRKKKQAQVGGPQPQEVRGEAVGVSCEPLDGLKRGSMVCPSC